MCIYFHLTACLSDRENLLSSILSLRYLYSLRKPTARTTLHLLHHIFTHPCFIFYPVCLSSLHILSHAPSLIFHLFSLCLSPVFISLFYFLLFSRCQSFLIFNSFSVSLLHPCTPTTPTPTFHHPGSHNSSLYRPLKCSLCDIIGPRCCSSQLVILL